MKKKIILTLLIVLGVMFLVLLSAVAVIIIKDQSIGLGRIFIIDDGSYMLVTDKSLTKMNDLSDGNDVFEGMTNGDLVMIGHTAVAQSYPSQTGVYWCIKLQSGGRADIPNDIITDLYHLGWISEMRYTILNIRDFSYASVGGRIYDELSEFPSPNVAVIHSLEELEDYYSRMGDGEHTSLSFSEDYNEEFFKTQMLVMIILKSEVTMSKTHIKSIGVMPDENLVIFMEREGEDFVETNSQWLYEIEFEKDIFFGDESDIVIWCDGEKIFDEDAMQDGEVTK